MRAIGLMSFGGPEVLQPVDIPLPEPGPGEVRIRVHAASVNPTDAIFRAGNGQARLLGDQPPPFVPGMDAAGIIDRIGPNNDAWLAVGDPVIALVLPAGPHGGAYADHIIAPSASVVRAPAGVCLAAAATVPLNGLTARVRPRHARAHHRSDGRGHRIGWRTRRLCHSTRQGRRPHRGRRCRSCGHAADPQSRGRRRRRTRRAGRRGHQSDGTRRRERSRGRRQPAGTGPGRHRRRRWARRSARLGWTQRTEYCGSRHRCKLGGQTPGVSNRFATLPNEAC